MLATVGAPSSLSLPVFGVLFATPLVTARAIYFSWLTRRGTARSVAVLKQLLFTR